MAVWIVLIQSVGSRIGLSFSRLTQLGSIVGRKCRRAYGHFYLPNTRSVVKYVHTFVYRSSRQCDVQERGGQKYDCALISILSYYVC